MTTRDSVTQDRIRHLENTLEDHEQAIETLQDLVRSFRMRLDELGTHEGAQEKCIQCY